MSQNNPSYEELQSRLSEAESVLEAIRSGSVDSVVGTHDVILLRLQEVERSLEESERRYRLLYEHMMDGLALFEVIPGRPEDPVDFRILSINPALERLTGLSAESVTGKAVLELVPNATGEFLDRLRKVAHSGTPIEFEHPSFVSDKVFWVKAFRTEPGKIALNVADFTDRIAAEKQSLLLTSAMHQASEGVVVTDDTGKVVYVNPAYESITGESASDTIGAIHWLFQEGSPHLSELRNLPAGQALKIRAHRNKQGSKGFDEAVTLARVYDERFASSHFIIVKRDVTREVEMEDKIRHMEKMEAVGQLAGGIAHDFNNMLQIILAYSQFARESLPPESRESEDLKKVVTAAGHAADLTRQLLAFSRQSALNIAAFDVSPLLKELTKLLERTIPASISVRLELAKDLPKVLADAAQAHQVILNLCLNSRDAMPRGGKLTLRAKACEFPDAEDAPMVELAGGRFVLIEVEDDGEGISPEILPRIFDPFFTTKEAGKGTGLGLASAYGIMRQHGGYLDCESQPGEGATFRIYFPIAPGEEVSFLASKTMQSLSGAERILLADDQEEIRRSLQRGLEGLGYKVMSFATGRQALDHYIHHRESIDVVVLDSQMPEMDGETCFQRMQMIHPRVRVILASGFVDPELRERMTALGVKRVLLKPYLIEDLAAVIREIMDQD